MSSDQDQETRQDSYWRLLDKNFLSQIVLEPVSHFSTSSVTSAGDNMMGTLLSAQVHTTSGRTHHLILKSVLPLTGSITQEDIDRSKFVAGCNRYPTEVTFYKEVQPLFRLLHPKTGSENLNLTQPHFYSSFLTENGFGDYLVLADLRPQGFKMLDKFVGMDLPQVFSVLKTLAELHASSFALLNGHKDGGPLQGHQDLASSPLNVHGWTPTPIIDVRKCFSEPVSGMIDLLTELDPNKYARFLPSLVEISETGYDLMMNLWRKTGLDEPFFRVLTHGDLWTNNILFGPGSQAVFIDWQLVKFGNIYEDLHYFFFTSTSAEFRRGNLDNCLKSYYGEFMKILGRLGVPLPKNFTEEMLLKTFRETMKVGLALGMMAIPYQLGVEVPPESKKEQSSELKSESELEQFGFGGMKEGIRNSPVGMNRLVGLIDEMIDYGVI